MSFTPNGLLFTNTPTNFNSPSTYGLSGQFLQSEGSTLPPIWVGITTTSSGSSITLKAPTSQRFTATGTTTGAMFSLVGGSAAIGSVYNNNGSTYLVTATYQGTTFLFTGGAGLGPAISGTTLQLLSGTGSSGIGFYSVQPLGTYSPPVSPAPLYLKIRIKGGGGGGGSAAGSASAGSSGLPSIFGTSLLIAFGGMGGAASTGPAPAYGGSIMIVGGPQILAQVSGGGSEIFDNGVASTVTAGSNGAGQGGGVGGYNSSGGSIGTPNSGAGGGGGGGTSGGASGAGGAEGGYGEILVTSYAASYPYAVGPGGAGSIAGTDAGGNGGAGVVVVEECYQ